MAKTKLTKSERWEIKEELSMVEWELFDNSQYQLERRAMWASLEKYREAVRNAGTFPYSPIYLFEIMSAALDYMEHYHAASHLLVESPRIAEEIRRTKVLANILAKDEYEAQSSYVNARNYKRFLPDYKEGSLCGKRELRKAKAAHILFGMLEYYHENWWE